MASTQLQNQINTLVQHSIQNFIEKISGKWNIGKKELENVWNGTEDKTQSEDSLTKVDSDDLSMARLMKASKAELSALCKKYSKKCSGTKDVLVNRLLGKEEDIPSVPSSTPSSSIKPEKKESKKSIRADDSISVIKKMTAKVPMVSLRRNKFNNLVHPETNIVLDKNHRALGTQNDDGSVDPLTDESIELCKKFKFQFDPPFNLDKSTLEDVEIAGMEDEEDEEEKELQEIETRVKNAQKNLKKPEDDVEALEDEEDEVGIEDGDEEDVIVEESDDEVDDE